MKEEVWLSIEGFEERYEVSDFGRVKRLARVVEAKDGSIRYYRELVLEPQPNKCRGYVAVRLYRADGTYKHIEVHRLVALHFLDNPNHLPIINHIDTVRYNNQVSNLEWYTYFHNLQHKGAFRKGREKMKKKVFQYTLDGDFVQAWSSATDAANANVDFNRSGICKVCNGHRPNYKGFIWRYE